MCIYHFPTRIDRCVKQSSPAFQKVKDGASSKSVEPEGQRTPGNCCYQEQPGPGFLEMQVLENSTWIWENFFKPLNLLCVTEFKCQRGKQSTYVCGSCCFSRNYHELCNKRSGYDACLSTGNCCLNRIFMLAKNTLIVSLSPFSTKGGNWLEARSERNH